MIPFLIARFSIELAGLIIVLGIAVIHWWHRYFTPAQYESVGTRYGLVRGKREPLKDWEARIFAASQEVCDAADALHAEASRLGNIQIFPSYQRPTMSPEVTWVTGIFFGSHGTEPYIAWLDNTHSLAIRYRKAAGPAFKPDA